MKVAVTVVHSMRYEVDVEEGLPRDHHGLLYLLIDALQCFLVTAKGPNVVAHEIHLVGPGLDLVALGSGYQYVVNVAAEAVHDVNHRVKRESKVGELPYPPPDDVYGIHVHW
jgi:hypothetical protein